MLVYALYMAGVILVGWYILGDNTSPKAKKICLAVTAIAALTIMTLRYGIGYDYISYEEIFKGLPGMSMKDILTTYNKEPLFYIFAKLLSMISSNYYILIFASNVIMVGCVFWTIYRYSSMWWLSSLLYMTLQFLPHSMNLLRQSIAASIIFAGWGFLKKGKFIPYALLVLLAGCFHISALIMLPAYFLMRMPFSLPVIATYGVGTAVAYFAFDPLLKFATTHILPQYAGYVGSDIYSAGNGFVLSIVPGMCLIAALIAAKPLIAKDKNNRVMIYSVFFAFVFYFFMSKMYIIERFSIYFFMVAMLLLPEIVSLLTPEPLTAKASPAAKIDYKDKKQNQQIATGAIVLVAVLYMLFSMKAGAHKVYPYVSIFNQQDAVGNNEYFQNH